MLRTVLKVHDQFCGAGGSSIGVRRAANRYGGNIGVSLAMNHWKLAIETHSTNFPDTDHDCADMSAVDPRRYTSADILITSPECTNHSLAKGVKRKYQETNTLFGNITIDPSAERSRATMWDVPRFAEVHNYKIIIVENVIDARNWVMWDAWLHAMRNLGYLHKCVYLNSQHVHPTPQSRDRMYVVFWKKGNKAPDLDIRPSAYCPECDKDVESIQTWKNPRKQYGKYKQQYLYCCPHCGSVVEPYYYASFNCIDWSIQGQRIGDRKKPLSPNTMKRIEHGVDKYGNQQLVLHVDHSSILDRFHTLDSAMFTQTTRQVAALINPPMIVYCNNSSGHRNHIRKMDEAMETQTTHHGAGLLVPGFMSKNYGGGFEPKHSPVGFDSPIGSITTIDHHSLVMMPHIVTSRYSSGVDCRVRDYNQPIPTQPGCNAHYVLGIPFITENFGSSKSKPITNPIGCQTTVNSYGLVSSESVNAFLTYYYKKSSPTGITEAINTVTTRDRTGLVLAPSGNIDINECSYRMLKPHEIQAAMAFESDYVICGNSKDKVKQLGNAVTPPVMELLIDRCIQTLL
ncbi:DNA cytosine methyltransferase [Proteiniphilum sp. X52]|uniref:DNA cytosine methyltransferase n=1 Tax=Proteiniphilum sp. X52 TaxID=2382159 RepID=UPI000F0A3587|nr:DNA cytosine methyltransferase [Proteiniphilum sp. X52]RNC66450.1 DNA cytosine methyltransferase [Proteiniphilum sp. X52]